MTRPIKIVGGRRRRVAAMFLRVFAIIERGDVRVSPQRAASEGDQ